MQLTRIIALASIAAIAACTTNPYTGEQQASKIIKQRSHPIK